MAKEQIDFFGGYKIVTLSMIKNVAMEKNSTVIHAISEVKHYK